MSRRASPFASTAATARPFPSLSHTSLMWVQSSAFIVSRIDNVYSYVAVGVDVVLVHGDQPPEHGHRLVGGMRVAVQGHGVVAAERPKGDGIITERGDEHPVGRDLLAQPVHMEGRFCSGTSCGSLGKCQRWHAQVQHAVRALDDQ